MSAIGGGPTPQKAFYFQLTADTLPTAFGRQLTCEYRSSAARKIALAVGWGTMNDEQLKMELFSESKNSTHCHQADR